MSIPALLPQTQYSIEKAFPVTSLYNCQVTGNVSRVSHSQTNYDEWIFQLKGTIKRYAIFSDCYWQTVTMTTKYVCSHKLETHNLHT